MIKKLGIMLLMSIALIGCSKDIEEDLGKMYWNAAGRACNNSVVGGFSDWRLPTREELSLISQNKDYIGGFSGYTYWSSENLGAPDWTFYFVMNGPNSGESYWVSGYDATCNVRAVRTIKE